jgi:hypothetical protein
LTTALKTEILNSIHLITILNEKIVLILVEDYLFIQRKTSAFAGNTTTATLTTTITGTNDLPTINALTAQSTNEDGTKVTGQLTVTDVDTGDTTTYTTTSKQAGLVTRRIRTTNTTMIGTDLPLNAYAVFSINITCISK